MPDKSSENKGTIDIKGVAITNPHKILFPKSKISKLDIVNYYINVEDQIIPELKNRQISMVRSPGGLNKGKFYQKHPSENFPDYIDRVKIKEKEGEDTYIEIDEIKDIVYLVNIGVIEFHTGNSTLDDYEHPDRIIFDLDPGEDTTDDTLELGAYILKYLLDGLKLDNWVKTSGGKGFHIIAELNIKVSWDEAKDMSKAIAESIVKNFPNKFTTSLSKEDRVGKVFIDYLRNARGGTTVAAFSVRAKEGASVSMPVEWDELPDIKPDKFNISDANYH